MRDTLILKLGGSIITDKKTGAPVLRTRRVKEIAREIKRALTNDKDMQLILLYGAGSFAHPLAHHYKLADCHLSKHTLQGVGYTIASVRELGTNVARIFLETGIPVIPHQSSSLAFIEKGRLRFTNLAVIRDILNNGGIPLLGGDVVISDHTRTAIASADALAVELAKTLGNGRLLFASDTDGVYETFPPKKGEKPLKHLDRSSLKKILTGMHSKHSRTDVTGAMPGKLRALLNTRGTTATIFNGNTPGVVAEVLSGKKRGTEITL